MNMLEQHKLPRVQGWKGEDSVSIANKKMHGNTTTRCGVFLKY